MMCIAIIYRNDIFVYHLKHSKIYYCPFIINASFRNGHFSSRFRQTLRWWPNCQILHDKRYSFVKLYCIWARLRRIIATFFVFLNNKYSYFVELLWIIEQLFYIFKNKKTLINFQAYTIYLFSNFFLLTFFYLFLFSLYFFHFVQVIIEWNT